MGESPRIDELRRRVQSDPASIAFASLAEEYRRAGRFEEAVATCEAGLQRHPAYLSARVTLGRSLLEMGRFDEAAGQLEHVLRVAPENLAAIRGLAEIHSRRKSDESIHGLDEQLAAATQAAAEPEPSPVEVTSAPAVSAAPEEPVGPAPSFAPIKLSRVAEDETLSTTFAAAEAREAPVQVVEGELPPVAAQPAPVQLSAPTQPVTFAPVTPAPAAVPAEPREVSPFAAARPAAATVTPAVPARQPGGPPLSRGAAHVAALRASASSAVAVAAVPPAVPVAAARRTVHPDEAARPALEAFLAAIRQVRDGLPDSSGAARSAQVR